MREMVPKIATLDSFDEKFNRMLELSGNFDKRFSSMTIEI